MKSILESSCREEIINRVKCLSDNHHALWGKMNAFQMAKHCTLSDEMIHGKIQIRRNFIGRLIGPMFLKKALEEGKPFGKNAPTAPALTTLSDSGDIETQKKEWIQSIEKYNGFQNDNFVHPFFGPMTREQIGVFVYKHNDHHLRQFGL